MGNRRSWKRYPEWIWGERRIKLKHEKKKTPEEIERENRLNSIAQKIMKEIFDEEEEKK